MDLRATDDAGPKRSGKTEKLQRLAAARPQKVVIVDLQIPFTSWVGTLVTVALASIPAAVIVAVVIWGIFAAIARLGHAQDYNIEAYCAEVAAAVGGSYQIEATCRQQEERAKQGASREIEERIRKYCSEVGQAVGGSYQIFMACVEQEERAKASLQ